MQNIKKRNKILEICAWILALLVLAGALVYYNFLAPSDNVVPYREGEECPDFTAKVYDGTDNGAEFVLSEHRGKVVILNFWATWCDPCVRELPYFNELQEKYKNDVSVVALHHVNITERSVQEFIDTPTQKKESWTDYSIIFAQDTEEIAKDVNGVEAPICTLLGNKDALPMTVIIDKDGKISTVTQGSVTYDMLEASFLKVLNS